MNKTDDLQKYETQRQASNMIDILAGTNQQFDIRLNALETSESGGAYVLVRDEKANNTAGGGFTSGAWQTRTLNTESVDTGNIASLSANRVTLQPGTYRFRGSAPAYSVNTHKVRLQNITAGTTVAVGTNSVANATSGLDMTRSEVTGVVTITVATAFELQHRCTTTKATDGFGLANNFSVVEVYATLEFWRE